MALKLISRIRAGHAPAQAMIEFTQVLRISGVRRNLCFCSLTWAISHSGFGVHLVFAFFSPRSQLPTMVHQIGNTIWENDFAVLLHFSKEVGRPILMFPRGREEGRP
jgi:hypothetical protein